MQHSPWKAELEDLIRGASGGFLFGIPLLYTVEAWWIGSYTEPPLMLGVLSSTYGVLFLLSRTDGFRQVSPEQPLDAAMDSVKALAIAILSAALRLFAIQEITWETPLMEGVGKVIFEGAPFALGVGLARSILSGQKSSAFEKAKFIPKDPPRLPPRLAKLFNYRATLADVGATLIGATIIALNIAPTDEVPMIAAAASPGSIVVLILASLVISYGIVFVAGFTRQKQRREQRGLFQRPIVETVLAYIVALGAAAVMLWLFRQISFSDPWTLWLKYVVILGLPASVGGAAGRLAV